MIDYAPKEFTDMFITSPKIAAELKKHSIDTSKLKSCNAMIFEDGAAVCFYVPSGKKSRIPKGYVGCDIATQPLCTLEFEIKDGKYELHETEHTRRVKVTE